MKVPIAHQCRHGVSGRTRAGISGCTLAVTGLGENITANMCSRSPRVSALVIGDTRAYDCSGEAEMTVTAIADEIQANA